MKHRIAVGFVTLVSCAGCGQDNSPGGDAGTSRTTSPVADAAKNAGAANGRHSTDSGIRSAPGAGGSGAAEGSMRSGDAATRSNGGTLSGGRERDAAGRDVGDSSSPSSSSSSDGSADADSADSLNGGGPDPYSLPGDPPWATSWGPYAGYMTFRVNTNGMFVNAQATVPGTDVTNAVDLAPQVVDLLTVDAPRLGGLDGKCDSANQHCTWRIPIITEKLYVTLAPSGGWMGKEQIVTPRDFDCTSPGGAQDAVSCQVYRPDAGYLNVFWEESPGDAGAPVSTPDPGLDAGAHSRCEPTSGSVCTTCMKHVTGAAKNTAIAVGGSTLYFEAKGNSTVLYSLSLTESGAMPKVLSEQLYGPMVIDDAHAYVFAVKGDAGGDVLSVPFAFAPTVTVTTGVEWPNYFYLANGRLYWSCDSPTMGVGVGSVPTSGGEKIVYETQLGNGVVADGKNVYWGGVDGIRNAPVEGGPARIILKTSRAARVRAIDGTAVYAIVGLDEIVRVALDGSSPRVLVSGEPGHLWDIAIDSKSVYFTNASGALKKVSLDGGCPVTLANSGPGRAVTVDTAGVYWVNTTASNASSFAYPAEVDRVTPK